MRLDKFLVDEGHVTTRSRAARLISMGRIFVDGVEATKPSMPVEADCQVTVHDDGWVSLAAHKLLGALDDISYDVPARVADCGSSTGGFTQVLLSRGAEQAFAIDVGHRQMADEVRSDPRVTLHEGVNVRDVTLEHTGGQKVGLLVADLSFISLQLVLEPMLALVEDGGSAIVLVKPQFEVGRAHLDGRGVVKDPHVARAGVDAVVNKARELGWRCGYREPARVCGESGNQEWVILLRRLKNND